MTTVTLKMRELAQDRGAHLGCIDASWEDACDDCTDILNDVFWVTYGQANNSADLINAILKDLQEERQ